MVQNFQISMRIVLNLVLTIGELIVYQLDIMNCVKRDLFRNKELRASFDARQWSHLNNNIFITLSIIAISTMNVCIINMI